MSTLKTQFNHVKNRISCSVKEFNREKGSVQLLAVSKTWPASHLRELAVSDKRHSAKIIYRKP